MERGGSVRYLTPVSRSIAPSRDGLFLGDRFATNTLLFGRPMGDSAYPYTARLFEEMVGAFFGCTHTRTKIINAEGESGYPDLIHVRSRHAHEVKAVSDRQSFDIRDNQIEYLRQFQRGNPYRLSYVVVRYRSPQTLLPELSQEELLSHLRDGVSYSLVLPLSVVDHLHTSTLEHPDRKTPFGYRYEGTNTQDRRKGWQPRTRIRPSFLKALVDDPQEALSSTGLNPDDYIVSPRMSPQRFLVHGKRLKPFPVVCVKDRRHREWLHDFTERYSERPTVQHQHVGFEIDDSYNGPPLF